MCYNVFKIKINLLKYNRFKDGRCSQTNAGSNHLNHKEGEKGAQVSVSSPHVYLNRDKFSSSNCLMLSMYGL